MPDKSSPEKMLEFIELDGKYDEHLSLNARNALWNSREFVYYRGMIEGFKEAGIGEEKIVEYLTHFLSKRGYPTTEEGRKFFRQKFTLARDFYHLVQLKEKDTSSSGYQESLKLLVEAHDRVLQNFDVAQGPCLEREVSG